ncbi:MAG: ATP-binding protein [bacterium]
MKNRLKNKILFLFSAFAVVLLVSIIIFFYISGSKFIRDESSVAVRQAAGLLNKALNDEITNSNLEITTLKKYIEISQIEESINVDKSAIAIEQLESFLLGNPFKYSELALVKSGWGKALFLRPVKVFSGQILTERTWKDKKPLPSPIQESISQSNIHNANRSETIFDIRSNSALIVDYFKSDTTTILYASLRLDYLFDRVIEREVLVPGVKSFFVNSAGFIIYSGDKSLLNNQINAVFPGFVFNREGNKTSFGAQSIEYNYLSWKNISVPGVFLVIARDNTEEYKRLNNSLIFAIIFSVVLFGLLMSVVYALTNRLANSLNRVINVSNKVAEGDLTQKIELHSSDEIGILITTFNDMVDKLRNNYLSLNRVNQELEEKIDELVKTKNELSKKEKLALIGETISKISHEIQNKVGGISIWVQNIEMQLKDETLKIYVKEMKGALKSFLEMLIDFKKFYRQPQLNKSVVSINNLIESVISNCRSEIENKQLSVKVNTDKDLPAALIDIGMMEEALLNIFINAVQFSPKSGKIIFNCSNVDRKLKVTIADDGPGIREEDREKIFNPFFTTNPGGSGLGLAIVNNIITAHGGTINFCNRGNGGTIFEILIPLEKCNHQPETL